MEWGSWDSYINLSLEDKWQEKKSKERGMYLTPSRHMRKLKRYWPREVYLDHLSIHSLGIIPHQPV